MSKAKEAIKLKEMSKIKEDVSVKIQFKKRPKKNSLVYLVSLIILSVGVSFIFYELIYKSEVAFLAIPIILIAGIFINIRGIINIIDFVFNLYTVTTVVCTDIDYKKDANGNISDKYSKVYFKDHRTGKNTVYTFRYKTKFSKGSAYRIIHGRLSGTYVSINR